MQKTINRRKFFRNTAISTAGILMGGNLLELSAKDYRASVSSDIMKEVMKYRKINAHEHVTADCSNVEAQIDFANRLAMDKLAISRPITKENANDATPEEFRKANDSVLKAMEMYPDRYLGMCYVNPIYGKMLRTISMGIPDLCSRGVIIPCSRLK